MALKASGSPANQGRNYFAFGDSTGQGEMKFTIEIECRVGLPRFTPFGALTTGLNRIVHATSAAQEVLIGRHHCI
jgi:hypothetical protein